jgi:hypothetical protein
VWFQPAVPQQVGPVGPFTSSSFLLGQIIYTNGIWTGDATFGFTLVTQSTDPLWNGKTFSDSSFCG